MPSKVETIMSSPVVVPVPPGPLNVPLKPSQQYKFVANLPCNICFTKNPLFVGISGVSTIMRAGQTLGPFVAPKVPAQINFNAVDVAEQCHPMGVQLTPKVIHVGSGAVRLKKLKKKKVYKKTPAKKKTAKKKTTKKKKARKKK
jgi:hypothetical protein